MDIQLNSDLKFIVLPSSRHDAKPFVGCSLMSNNTYILVEVSLSAYQILQTLPIIYLGLVLRFSPKTKIEWVLSFVPVIGFFLVWFYIITNLKKRNSNLN